MKIVEHVIEDQVTIEATNAELLTILRSSEFWIFPEDDPPGPWYLESAETTASDENPVDFSVRLVFTRTMDKELRERLTRNDLGDRIELGPYR